MNHRVESSGVVRIEDECAAIAVGDAHIHDGRAAICEVFPDSQDLAGAESAPVTRIHVLLVDSDEGFAESSKRALARFAVEVSIAGSVACAHRLISQQGDRFDGVLLGAYLTDGRGEDLLPEIEALPRQPGVVILRDEHAPIRPEAVSYRAASVPKEVDPSVLAAILRYTAAGYAGDTIERFARRFKLTGKESAVLKLIARGNSPKEVAADFHCSLQAVYAHLAGMCEKTNTTSYLGIVATLFQFSCHGLGHESDSIYDQPGLDVRAGFSARNRRHS